MKLEEKDYCMKNYFSGLYNIWLRTFKLNTKMFSVYMGSITDNFLHTVVDYTVKSVFYSSGG